MIREGRIRNASLTSRRDGGGEAVEQSRLDGLGATGDRDVQAAPDRCPGTRAAWAVKAAKESS